MDTNILLILTILVIAGFILAIIFWVLSLVKTKNPPIPPEPLYIPSVVAIGKGSNTIAYSIDDGENWTGLGTEIFSQEGTSAIKTQSFGAFLTGKGLNNIVNFKGVDTRDGVNIPVIKVLTSANQIFTSTNCIATDRNLLATPLMAAGSGPSDTIAIQAAGGDNNWIGKGKPFGEVVPLYLGVFDGIFYASFGDATVNPTLIGHTEYIGVVAYSEDNGETWILSSKFADVTYSFFTISNGVNILLTGKGIGADTTNLWESDSENTGSWLPFSDQPTSLGTTHVGSFIGDNLNMLVGDLDGNFAKYDEDSLTWTPVIVPDSLNFGNTIFIAKPQEKEYCIIGADNGVILKTVDINAVTPTFYQVGEGLFTQVNSII